jgi:hypothetical protein
MHKIPKNGNYVLYVVVLVNSLTVHSFELFFYGVALEPICSVNALSLTISPLITSSSCLIVPIRCVLSTHLPLTSAVTLSMGFGKD